MDKFTDSVIKVLKKLVNTHNEIIEQYGNTDTVNSLFLQNLKKQVELDKISFIIYDIIEYAVLDTFGMKIMREVLTEIDETKSTPEVITFLKEYRTIKSIDYLCKILSEFQKKYFTNEQYNVRYSGVDTVIDDSYITVDGNIILSGIDCKVYILDNDDYEIDRHTHIKNDLIISGVDIVVKKVIKVKGRIKNTGVDCRVIRSGNKRGGYFYETS